MTIKEDKPCKVLAPGKQSVLAVIVCIISREVIRAHFTEGIGVSEGAFVTVIWPATCRVKTRTQV